MVTPGFHGRPMPGSGFNRRFDFDPRSRGTTLRFRGRAFDPRFRGRDFDPSFRRGRFDSRFNPAFRGRMFDPFFGMRF
jgi:hypothetical protein